MSLAGNIASITGAVVTKVCNTKKWFHEHSKVYILLLFANLPLEVIFFNECISRECIIFVPGSLLPNS